jgi:hypothetical protein
MKFLWRILQPTLAVYTTRHTKKNNAGSCYVRSVLKNAVTVGTWKTRANSVTVIIDQVRRGPQ